MDGVGRTARGIRLARGRRRAARCFARTDGAGRQSRRLLADRRWPRRRSSTIFRKNRALDRDADAICIGGHAERMRSIPAVQRRSMLGEGLAIPVRTGAGEGPAVPGRHAEPVDRSSRPRRADRRRLAAHIQRHALLEAAEDSAEARSRLSLARDLHDSVVQFLAGAAFRLEAMKRSEASGADARARAQRVEAADAPGARRAAGIHHRAAQRPRGRRSTISSSDLRALAGRLARQWDIECEFLGRRRPT